MPVVGPSPVQGVAGSFVQRQLQFRITLAPGNTGLNQPKTFANTTSDTNPAGSNQLTLPPLRASARIQNGGAPTMSTASVKIWGLALTYMQQLSTLGLRFTQQPRNQIQVYAIDPVAGPVQIFSGIIIDSYADYSLQPDVPLIMEAQVGADYATLQADASTFPGPTDVAKIMQSLAQKMGLRFENNDVNGVMVDRPGYDGPLLGQMLAAARDAGVVANIINDTLILTRPFSERKDLPTPVLGPTTGMIGSPGFTQQGVLVKSIFNPQIQFGGSIRIESAFVQPQTYIVQKLDHALDTQVPKGQWMSSLFAYALDPIQPIIPPP